jgi:pimeloyl-ACP methyl ester carboxylesterase
MMFFKKRSNKESVKGKPAQKTGAKDVSASIRAEDIFRSHAKRAPEEPASDSARSVSQRFVAGNHPAGADDVEPATFSEFSIVVNQMSDLMSASRGKPKGAKDGEWFVFGRSQGGRSAIAVPAMEGDRFRATASVRLVTPGTNGFESGFYFGPLFFDAEGKVVTWWARQDMPKAGEVTKVSVERVAPPRTASVRLGMNGPYDSSGNTADYVVGINSPRLHKVSGV